MCCYGLLVSCSLFCVLTINVVHCVWTCSPVGWNISGAVEQYWPDALLGVTYDSHKTQLEVNFSLPQMRMHCKDHWVVDYRIESQRNLWISDMPDSLPDVVPVTSWYWRCNCLAWIELTMSRSASWCNKSVLTPSTPAVPNCCCSTGPAPYWSNPPFLSCELC